MQKFLPYLSYLKAVRTPLIGAILCGLIYGAATGAGLPLMLKEIFPLIFDASAAPLGPWELAGIALWLPVVFTIRGVTGYYNGYLIQYAGVRILEALRLDYFSKLQQLPLSFFHRSSTGDLVARGLGDTNQLQNTLTVAANDIIKQPATLLGALGYLIYLISTQEGVGLILISLGAIPICILPIHLVGKKLAQRARRVQMQAGAITGRFTENLAAVKEVRGFCLEKMEAERFAEASAAMVRAQMSVAKYTQLLTPIIGVIAGIGVSITFVYAYKVHIELAMFLSIVTALYVSYEPIKRLGGLNNELRRGAVSLTRLEEVLHEPNAIEDPISPVEVGRLCGNIDFQRVSFAYRVNEPVLRDVSVQIPAGAVCALVGPSGAGKSTFADLVPRFYDVIAGAVRIDGIDVRAMRQADLRRNVAVVSQTPVLFDDTIHNNLRFGRLDASRAEVEQAARDAYAHEFIQALPEGYETVVGERGSKLSGGQRQRIAIARAFLRAAPILILDEATSALDSESEEFVHRALKKLIAGRTVLIIAHRFSTIRDASMILVFNEAQIVARGAHAELYASNALYRTLYDKQLAVG
jgi:subfamily B ATP-binding cassette protein MsbA